MLPMGERRVGREVIARLVKKVGSVEIAALRLGIRPGLVQRFFDGQTQVPDSVLLKALDLVAADADSPVQALQPESKPPKGRPVI
jgi:hypothetical protein